MCLYIHTYLYIYCICICPCMCQAACSEEVNIYILYVHKYLIAELLVDMYVFKFECA